MTPRTEAELSEFIKSSENPLRIIGGGTRQSLGNPIGGQALSTASLTGITLYEPGALTIVARAGTPLAEIEAQLDKENQQLPFEPMNHQHLLSSKGNPSIGGIVACNISGPRRIQAGACRDSLIGVRFVDGLGNIVKNGGRVMKNVTGYDLVKLIAGSFGTLGVLSEIAFKVLPKPETTATVILHGLSNDDGVAALCTGLNSPNDVNGAAHMYGVDGPMTLLRVEGFEKSVAYRVNALKDKFMGYEISIETDAKKHTKHWQTIRDVLPFKDKGTDIWRLSVTPSDGPKVVQHLNDQDVETDSLFDWSGGSIWLSVAKDTKLRSHLAGFTGHATLIRGDAEPAFHPQHKVITDVESALRNKFDPKQILNTGIMG